jgi:hypothetical protein
MFSDHIGTLPGAPRQHGAVPRSFLLLAWLLLANRKDNQTRSGGLSRFPDFAASRPSSSWAYSVRIVD